MDTDDKERRSDKVMPVEETDAPGGWEPIGTAGLVGTSRRLSQEMAERRRAEAAVRASETRLRAIVNAVPDVLCVLDEDGRYVEILTSQPQLLYAEPESLRGRLLTEVLPAELAGRLLQTILVREGGLEETGDLLLKPYRKASLADKLRALLDTSRSS